MQLMTHLIAGYPTLKYSEAVALKLLQQGAHILEIQIPFSDPIADGPVITQANTQALQQNISTEDCFKMITRLSLKIGQMNKANNPSPIQSNSPSLKIGHVPRLSNNPPKKAKKSRDQAPTITIMTYFNIAYNYGLEKFCKKAKAAGASAIIIPDYPIDEEPNDNLIEHCKNQNLGFVPVIAPTTRPERLKKLCKLPAPFIYCMARAGITGQETKINPQTIKYLKNIRQHTKLPLAVGFGIKNSQQIKALNPYAEIAIVGTALIQSYKDQPQPKGLKSLESKMNEIMPSS